MYGNYSVAYPYLEPDDPHEEEETETCEFDDGTCGLRGANKARSYYLKVQKVLTLIKIFSND